MANECQVFEQILPRSKTAPIRVVPFLAKQTLDAGGDVSVAFGKSTEMVSIVSSVAGTVEFTTTSGVDPSGAGMTFPIAADQVYDFDVRPGTKVRFV